LGFCRQFIIAPVIVILMIAQSAIGGTPLKCVDLLLNRLTITSLPKSLRDSSSNGYEYELNQAVQYGIDATIRESKTPLKEKLSNSARLIKTLFTADDPEKLERDYFSFVTGSQEYAAINNSIKGYGRNKSVSKSDPTRVYITLRCLSFQMMLLAKIRNGELSQFSESAILKDVDSNLLYLGDVQMLNAIEHMPAAVIFLKELLHHIESTFDLSDATRTHAIAELRASIKELQ
jgi:hypothetical protein